MKLLISDVISNRFEAMNSNDIRDFVFRWNVLFPIDKWWRVRHHVAFNSEQHSRICMLDQIIEYVEEQIYKEWIKDDKDDSSYTPGICDYIRDVTESYTEKDYDRIYKNLDLNNIIEK